MALGIKSVLDGRKTFRDAFREMLESIPLSFEKCAEILKRDIKLDPGFADFYAWCKTQSIPVVIVSSGMAPLIRAVLSNLIGDEEASKIEIISNDVKIDGNGHWEIQYRHPESGFGHDKSQAILPYRSLNPAPTLFFFGDGVSDMSAAQHADVLFVKLKENGESDLATYCDTLGIKNIKFQDFSQVLPIVREVVTGTKTTAEALAIGNASQG